MEHHLSVAGRERLSGKIEGKDWGERLRGKIEGKDCELAYLATSDLARNIW